MGDLIMRNAKAIMVILAGAATEAVAGWLGLPVSATLEEVLTRAGELVLAAAAVWWVANRPAAPKAGGSGNIDSGDGGGAPRVGRTPGVYRNSVLIAVGLGALLALAAAGLTACAGAIDAECQLTREQRMLNYVSLEMAAGRAGVPFLVVPFDCDLDGRPDFTPAEARAWWLSRQGGAAGGIPDVTPGPPGRAPPTPPPSLGGQCAGGAGYRGSLPAVAGAAGALFAFVGDGNSDGN